MDTLEVATVAAWVLALVAGLRASTVARGTTLQSVVPWVCGALCLWLGVSLQGMWAVSSVAPARGYLTHLAAVLSLVPAMAVLGARRPTVRVWSWFVLLPMIVVLSWPVVSITAATGWSRPLQLETAHALIFALVVVMGYGNYVGTRLTLPTLLAGMVLIGTVFAMSTSGSSRLEDQQRTLALCRLALAVASVWASWLCRQPAQHAERVDRVWDDFVSLYGLVWSRRLLDRLRLLAAQHHWKCDVTAAGFVFAEPRDPQTQAAVEHALRWLLRRFVDPEWLDDRLGDAPETTAPTPTIDV